VLAYTDVRQFVLMKLESLRLKFYGEERRRRRMKKIWRIDVEIEEEGELWRTEEEEEEEEKEDRVVSRLEMLVC